MPEKTSQTTESQKTLGINIAQTQYQRNNIKSQEQQVRNKKMHHLISSKRDESSPDNLVNLMSSQISSKQNMIDGALGLRNVRNIDIGSFDDQGTFT